MKGSLVRFACIAILMQLSCNAAHAVTWFDSNIRPDGVGDSNQAGNVYMAPAEDGTQVVYGNTQDVESVADAFESTAGE
ncbi:MAG: hypothetical protein K2X81_03195 [Candidatus Obscuribacterales bacterium]|nr:hypothetical protein [Candidatus Obscuribacterales bacterium]